MAPALLPLNPSFGSPAPACAFQRPRCQKRPLLSLGIGPRSAPRRSFSSPAPASSLFPPAQTRLWSMEYPPGNQRPAMGFRAPLGAGRGKTHANPLPSPFPPAHWAGSRKGSPAPSGMASCQNLAAHAHAVPSGGQRRHTRIKEAPRPLPRSGILPHQRGHAPTPCKTPSRRSSAPAPAAPLFPPARCTRSPAALRQGWRDRPARRSSGSDPSRASDTRPRPCPARSGSSPLFPPAEGAPPCVPGSP